MLWAFWLDILSSDSRVLTKEACLPDTGVTTTLEPRGNLQNDKSLRLCCFFLFIDTGRHVSLLGPTRTTSCLERQKNERPAVLHSIKERILRMHQDLKYFSYLGKDSQLRRNNFVVNASVDGNTVHDMDSSSII